MAQMAHTHGNHSALRISFFLINPQQQVTNPKWWFLSRRSLQNRKITPCEHLHRSGCIFSSLLETIVRSCRTTPFSSIYEFTGVITKLQLPTPTNGVCHRFWWNSILQAFSNLYFIMLNLCKYYTSKNVNGNCVYFITRYIHSNLPRLQAILLYMFSRKEKLCTLFHIPFLHWKDLEVGEKHKHTVSETNAAALSE